MHGARREAIVGNRILLIGGDIVLTINQDLMNTWDEVDAYLEEETEIGQKVRLTVLRDGREITLTLTLAERPPDI